MAQGSGKVNWPIEGCERIADEWRRQQPPISFTENELKAMTDLELLRWASYEDSKLNQLIARLKPAKSSCVCTRNVKHSSVKNIMGQPFDWTQRIQSKSMNAACLCLREFWLEPNGIHCPHWNVVLYSFSMPDLLAIESSTLEDYKLFFQYTWSELSEGAKGKLLEKKCDIWIFWDPKQNALRRQMGDFDMEGLEELYRTMTFCDKPFLQCKDIPRLTKGPITFLEAARLKRGTYTFSLPMKDLKTFSDVQLLRLAAFGSLHTNEKIARLTPREAPCLCSPGFSNPYVQALTIEPLGWEKRVMNEDMNVVCHVMQDSLPEKWAEFCPHWNIMLLEYPNYYILNDHIQGFWTRLDQFEAYKRYTNQILSHLSEEGQARVHNHECKLWFMWDTKDNMMTMLWDNSEMQGLSEEDRAWIENFHSIPQPEAEDVWWKHVLPSNVPFPKLLK